MTALRSFKTISKKEHYSIFCLALLLLLIISFFINKSSTSFVLISVGGYLSYNYIPMLFATNGNIAFEENTFTIDINGKLTGRYEYQFNIIEIRGFEISVVRKYDKALLIYTHNKCFKIELPRASDHEKVEAFFIDRIKKLDKYSNPNFKSLGAAYSYALRLCCLFLLVTTPITLLIAISAENEAFSKLTPLVSYLTAASFGYVGWKFIMANSLKKKHFRFLAYQPFTNFFIYLSPLLIFSIISPNNSGIAEVLAFIGVNLLWCLYTASQR